jgi:hypothetical protein
MGSPPAGPVPNAAGGPQPDPDGEESSEIAAVLMRIKVQQALVIDLARAKRFDQLPAAHHLLRKLEDELKRARDAKRFPTG